MAITPAGVNPQSQHPSPMVSYNTSDKYPDIDSVCQRIAEILLYDKYNDCVRKQVLHGINAIITHEPLGRFYRNGTLSLTEQTLTVLSDLFPYSDEKAYKKFSAQRPDKNTARAIKNVCNEMASLYLRPKASLKLTSTKGKKTFEQECGHINHEGELVVGTTLNSNILKKAISANAPFNLNLGVIQEIAGKEKILHTIRSGRTDNPSRIIKLIQYGFIHSMNSINKPGISFNDDGTPPSYQIVILTAQDGHPLRNFAKKISRNPPMTESESLNEIYRCVDELWKEDSGLLLKVNLDGKEYTFLAKKPIVINVSLSQAANCPEEIKASRKRSVPGMLRCLDLLRRSEFAQKSQTFGKAFAMLSSVVKEGGKLSADHAKTFFRGIQENAIISKDLGIFDQKLYLALKGVKIGLTHSDFEDHAFLNAVHPAYELLYYYHLVELINATQTVQCKAGCDRALIMVALHLANKHFEEENNRMMDLALCQSNDERQAFVDTFTKGLQTLGPPVLNACRGNTTFYAADKPIMEELIPSKSIEGLDISQRGESS